MKRVSKSFLLVGGVLSMLLCLLMFIGSFITFACGFGVGFGVVYPSLMSLMDQLAYETTDILTVITNFITTSLYGIAGATALLATSIRLSICAYAMITLSLLALLSMSALADKKGMLLVDIIAGGLFFLYAFVHGDWVPALVILLVLVGAVLGLVALAKEKAQEEKEAELED